MEKNKNQIKWLEQHNYYQLKPNSTIYVRGIDVLKVSAKIFIDASSADMADYGYIWDYSHGIYSIENKEKLTNEEIEEATTWLLACSDSDFANYLRSGNDEKR